MRVLIVSPHFPPVNAADGQRIRLLAPYFAEVGIEATILTVNPEGVDQPRDDWLATSLPDDLSITPVTARSLRWRSLPGLGSLSSRALGALRKAGNAELRTGSYDLVYFSTTQFGLHVLGPEWRERFEVPFVMDYQDPWVNDYYRDHPDVIPPGGRLKFALAYRKNQIDEPRVLSYCSGFTSVSPRYPAELAQRYPDLSFRETKNGPPLPGEIPFLILPFPGDSRDFARLRDEDSSSPFPSHGVQNWVYVGRAFPPMGRTLRILFASLAGARSVRPDPVTNLRLHFVGTSHLAGAEAQDFVRPIAEEYGLADIVTESPSRIPYREVLRHLLEADALIVPGTDDPGYTASKIYPYLLSNRPLLALFHEESSVVHLINTVGGGHVIPFRNPEDDAKVISNLTQKFLDWDFLIPQVPLDLESFRPFTAKAQAETLCGFFRTCLENS
ncbi:MAG: hypothetical protein AAGC68_02685 [Verrucomicrobiota bacterium]